jgi:hypothetical protein
VSQVHISRHDHTVTVNHDGGDLAYVVEKAQKLWDETRPPEQSPGPAFGFQAERAHGRGGFAWGMKRGEQPAVDA